MSVDPNVFSPRTSSYRPPGSHLLPSAPGTQSWTFRARAAIAYLNRTPTTKGGHEVGQALAQLKKLGYIKKVS